MSRGSRGGRRSDPRPVGNVIESVLDDLGLEAAAGAFRIGEAWSECVGPEAAEHSRPVGLRAGVVEVAVDTSVWSQQLQLRRTQILERLRAQLGEDAPKDLRFRVGYTTAQ